MCHSAEVDPAFSSVAMESASKAAVSNVTTSVSALHRSHHARQERLPRIVRSWLV